MEDKLYINPSNKMDFFKGCLSSIIIIIVLGSIVILFPLKYEWIILIITLAIAFAPFYIGWERQYISRPHHIEILNDGIFLYFRYGKGKKFVRYEQIKWIDVLDPNHIKSQKSDNSDGYIGLGNKLSDIHPVIWPLAIQIRDRYRLKMGVNPPSENPIRVQ